MEINIESSLAAMAFVVADQQDTIKSYREWHVQAQHEKDELDAALTAKIEELERCEKEIRLLHKDIDELKVSCAAKEIEANEFKRDVDALSVELEQNRILWRAIDPEDSGKNITIIVPPEVLARKSIIVVKNKVIDNGVYSVDGYMMHIGTEYITLPYPKQGADGGWYIVLEPDNVLKPILWAVIPCLAEKEVFDV
ncbi:MAG: hypothetical protein KBT34_07255 [Prevotella sp.]|nr:hypothetical protein [Candidatus Prevotella equi]